MTIIYALVLFLGSQIYLIKGNIPEKYKNIKLRYFLLMAVGIILLAAVIGQAIGLGSFFVVTATVLCSSMIMYRFQQKYDEMERGKI